MQRSETHIPVLDAIRGLAILLVLFIHVGESIPTATGYGWGLFRSVASSSWVGVDLFFVLSGFLITGILYDTTEASNFFKVFYARRFLRIFPVYYGFIFLLFAFTIPLQIDWHGRQWIYLLYLQNTRIIKHVQSATLSPYFKIDHLWSLAVEEQFYFVWPAFVYLVRDRARLVKITGTLMIGSMLVRLFMLYAGKSLWMIYIFTPARADSLMMGSGLALLFRSGLQAQQRLRRVATFALPLSTVVLIALALPTHGLNFSSRCVILFGYTVVALASASLMTLSLTDARFGLVINRPVLRWLGKYSYGIYVLHLPIMMMLLNVPAAKQIEGMFNNPFWKLSVVIAATAVPVGLAFLSFNLYESRFLRLKRFFRYEFQAREAQRADLIGTKSCLPES